MFAYLLISLGFCFYHLTETALSKPLTLLLNSIFSVLGALTFRLCFCGPLPSPPLDWITGVKILLARKPSLAQCLALSRCLGIICSVSGLSILLLWVCFLTHEKVMNYVGAPIIPAVCQELIFYGLEQAKAHSISTGHYELVCPLRP